MVYFNSSVLILRPGPGRVRRGSGDTRVLCPGAISVAVRWSGQAHMFNSSPHVRFRHFFTPLQKYSTPGFCGSSAPPRRPVYRVDVFWVNIAYVYAPRFRRSWTRARVSPGRVAVVKVRVLSRSRVLGIILLIFIDKLLLGDHTDGPKYRRWIRPHLLPGDANTTTQ